MAGGRFLGRAMTRPGFRKVLFDEGYPALYFSKALPSAVAGELYAVEEEHLKRLDVFEGCPDWYQREVIELDDGTQAFAYLIPEERGCLLPDFEGK
jgi:gamma-glutamylcyclotransferase (GGCT)/AIG2-like uncharacterized protein YtfP